VCVWQVIKELKDAKKFGVEEGNKKLLEEGEYKKFARKFADVQGLFFLLYYSQA